MTTTITVWNNHDKGLLVFDTPEAAQVFRNTVLTPYRDALWNKWQHLPVSKSNSDTWIQVSVMGGDRFIAY